jgi:WD40 repeat protein
MFNFFSYDPGAENDSGGGNLCAVGTLQPQIEIWDLDLVEAVVPSVTLGDDKSGKKTTVAKRSVKKKAKLGLNGHTDAVLDVAHNQNMPHVLASGGADRRTILWDLDATSVHTVFKRCRDKVCPFPALFHHYRFIFRYNRSIGTLTSRHCWPPATCPARCVSGMGVMQVKWPPNAK